MTNNVVVVKSIKHLFTYIIFILTLIMALHSSLLGCSALASETNNESKVQNLELINFRIMGDESRVRVISIYNAKPEADIQILGTPPRLVINLPKTTFTFSPNSATEQGIVKHIRYGVSGAQTSRIILGMSHFFQVENVSYEQLDNGLWQHIFDIVSVSEDVFDKTLKLQQEQQRLKLEQKQNSIKNQTYRIVLDAGHGGKDSGAIGIRNSLEKDITLSVAKTLKVALEKHPNIKVYLTRDDDTFLRLGERVSRARAWNADLFVSLHADSIKDNGLRGATIYTISDKASDSIARNLAESENKADLLDGLPADEYPEIADILLDLTQKETHRFSLLFADHLVKNLQKSDIHMIKNPHRYAGFQVLRAPDIPSLLIEVGYLSNEEDEQLITNQEWREKISDVIAETIYKYTKLHRSRNP